MPNEFKRKMSEQTDEQLINILSHRDEFIPEAVEAAEAEIKRRNLEFSTLKLGDTVKNSPDTLIVGEKELKILPAMWLGYVIACLFLIVESLQIIANPSSAGHITPLNVIVGLAGFVYWFYCIYRIHKFIQVATRGKHPISPGEAVGYSFIPIFNMYWIFKWPNEISKFIAKFNMPVKIPKGLVGLLILMGIVLSRFDTAICLTILFSVGKYLTYKISKGVMTSSSVYEACSSSELRKGTEAASRSCPVCGNKLKEDWKACPFCG